MLLNLSIRNYKSLRDVKLENLPNFCVMVGANASGKSNFADALDFLSLVFQHGLSAAVRAKGGYENICFRRVRRSKAGIEFALTVEAKTASRGRARLFRYEYTFGLRTASEAIDADYFVTHESFEVSSGKSPRRVLRMQRPRAGKIQVAVGKGAESLGLPPAKYLRDFLERPEVQADELFLPTRVAYFTPIIGLLRLMGGCRVYQISPHTARAPGVPGRSPELGKHGENLPAAVQYLKENEDAAFEELEGHLKYAVPTMESLETDYVETKELGLFFRESGVGRRWYSQDVSDGTLKTVSMFLPLLDPRVTMMVIEEPENSLHPWILRHFMDACQTGARTKQVFVTTHSPTAVDKVPIESLFIVSRRHGVTRIERADTSSPDAKSVVRAELYGLGEYWDSGAIGGVPGAEDTAP